MDVKIRTKNFSSNEGVEALAKKELTRVEKMFAEETIFDVCVKKEKDEANKALYKCDITIKNGKHFLRGYGEGNTVESSLDFAVDSLKRKARKAKTFAKKKREYSKFVSPEYATTPEPSMPFRIRIEREKEIEADVMTPEEAAMQMELSGHEFFVYRNDKGNMCVLYKRKGGYGILTTM